jgi:hypothetical protein
MSAADILKSQVSGNSIKVTPWNVSDALAPLGFGFPAPSGDSDYTIDEFLRDIKIAIVDMA